MAKPAPRRLPTTDRLLDENEQLRTALEAAQDEITLLVSDRKQLLATVAAQSRTLRHEHALGGDPSPQSAERLAHWKAERQGETEEELRVTLEEMQVLTEELDVANQQLSE